MTKEHFEALHKLMRSLKKIPRWKRIIVAHILEGKLNE